jgi:CRISPR/Cas system-associated exonuclease Cas4 (RecB family)
MIKSWSHSRMVVFEQCKRRAFLQYHERIPDPKPSPFAERGTQVHDACEKFVRGITEHVPAVAESFSEELYQLRALYKQGSVELEGEWGFDRDWQEAEWKSAWLRLKCDAVVFLSDTHVLIVDYKTGKRVGNEVKHGEQVQLYALAVLRKYPQVETVSVELWYFDKDDIFQDTKIRVRWMHHLRPYTRRGLSITEATDFPPNPNIFSCNYCPYKPEPNGTGHCSVGVTRSGEALGKVYARKAVRKVA